MTWGRGETGNSKKATVACAWAGRGESEMLVRLAVLIGTPSACNHRGGLQTTETISLPCSALRSFHRGGHLSSPYRRAILSYDSSILGVFRCWATSRR